MSEKGIIKGYGRGTFQPNKEVSRDEFATMLTLALNLTLSNPEKQTFVDVNKDHWAYKYIETSKSYLTGYKTSSGIKFFGTDKVLREDATVALVKAMGYQEDALNKEEFKSTFKDYNSVSPNLQKYIFIAKKRGLIGGTDGYFYPKAPLTRAEVAVLLWKLSDEKNKGEKVVF